MDRGNSKSSYRKLSSGEEEDNIARASQWVRDGEFHDNDAMRQGHQITAQPQSEETTVHTHPAFREQEPGALGISSSSDTAATSPKVTFDEEQQGPSHGRTFAAHRRRMNTKLDDAPVEVRHTHDYIFRRPRPLMVEHQGHLIELGEYGKLDVKNPELSYLFKKDKPYKREHHPDSLNKQRERMDLFVDLIWVGIISNLSENFFSRVFKQKAELGAAVGEFVLLFVPAFRIWICLQQWLNSYYMDDYFQRFFIVWILILAVIWGNNAPYLIESFEKNDNFVIITYLVAVGSFLLAQLVYSHWLPWLRRPMLIGFLFGLPGSALWIALTVIQDPFDKLMLLMASAIYGLFETIFFASPLADRLLGNEIRRASDNRIMLRRYENFFVIAIGEGVFLLIRESPLGAGLSVGLGRGIQALLIYYFLNWTYFHGDVSKRFIHPIDRRWWIKLLWQWFHIPLFASLVLLSSGTLFLVEYTAGESEDGSETSSEPTGEGEGEAIKFDQHTFRTAVATTCVSVAISLFCQLAMALLSRSVDEPHSLLVTNPLIRMIPRLIAIVVLSVIWVVDFTDPSKVLGIVLAIVSGTMGLEQLMGMPKHAKIFEPKEASLTPVISPQSL